MQTTFKNGLHASQMRHFMSPFNSFSLDLCETHLIAEGGHALLY